MEFQYFAGQQRTPEWFALRIGKVTASRLVDWMAVSQAKATPGKPLKARLDYEKELMFERQFNRSFDHYVTGPMQDGIDYEQFAITQYEKFKGVAVEECGAWYNDQFVASPDGLVGKDGLVEVKILGDNSFTALLTEGVKDAHWKQVQGQLWASKRKWCDYIALNLNTRTLKVVRILPDPEFHEWLELIVPEKLVSEPLNTEDTFEVQSEDVEARDDIVPMTHRTDITPVKNLGDW